MARRSRVLVVGADRFVWSVSHSHEGGCREVVRLRRDGSRGQLVVVFAAGAGRFVADGFLHAGQVLAADGRALNLNEPGVVRALLDSAVGRGWQVDAPGRVEVDGWELFAAVADRRSAVRG